MHAYQHTARARDTRARCPPDKLTPRSPMTCQQRCTLNSVKNTFALRKPRDVYRGSKHARTVNQPRHLHPHAPEEQLGPHNRPFAIVEIVKIRFQSTYAYDLRAGQ